MASKTEPTRRGTSGARQPEMGHVGGHAAARDVICRITVELGVSRYLENLKAIVLTGSLAREEGTFSRDVNSWRLLGDAEFLFVFRQDALLPLAEELSAFQKAIESKLLDHGVKTRISLAPVHSAYLRHLRPHIFGFELLTHGCVLWGDPVISQIPAFSAAAIPMEDAWRLLCNRMIELIESCVMLTDKSRELPREVFYQTVKLSLDMGTSFLIFAGGYESTYASRAEKIQLMQLEAEVVAQCPIDLYRFAQRIQACTQYKLSGNEEFHLMGRDSESDNLAFWRDAVTDARDLWRWELARLTDIGEELTDQELMKRWMAQQPMKDRIRGWLFVLRREGWGRSWRKWFGWLRLGLHASPRYCIYAAASELFFQLVDLASAPSGKLGQVKATNQQFEWLPVLGNLPNIENNWRQRASEIAWNYHRFLEGTRS